MVRRVLLQDALRGLSGVEIVAEPQGFVGDLDDPLDLTNRRLIHKRAQTRLVKRKRPCGERQMPQRGVWQECACHVPKVAPVCRRTSAQLQELPLLSPVLEEEGEACDDVEDGHSWVNGRAAKCPVCIHVYCRL